MSLASKAQVDGPHTGSVEQKEYGSFSKMGIGKMNHSMGRILKRQNSWEMCLPGFVVGVMERKKTQKCLKISPILWIISYFFMVP